MPKKKVKRQKGSSKSSNSVSAFIKKFFLLLLVGVIVGTGTLWLKNSSGVLGVSTSCNKSTPSINTDPISVTGNYGATATYRVIVRNNDSAGCSNRRITLSRTNPSKAWKGGFGNSFASSVSYTSKPNSTSVYYYKLKSPEVRENTKEGKYYAYLSLDSLNVKKAVIYNLNKLSVTFTPYRQPTPTPTKRPTPTPAR